MTAVLNFLKSNWQIAVLIFSIVGTVAGVKFTLQKGPADQPPEVIVVIPSEGEEPLISQSISAAERDRHPLLNIACRFAGRRYARQHDGLKPAEGIALAQAVPVENIKAQCAAEGINPFGVGYQLNARGEVVGGPIIDWLKVPGNLEKLITIIMMLIPLFA